MMLLTKENEKTLKPLYEYEKLGIEPVAVIKFFDPTGSWTWYVAEGQKREDGDWLFWGLVDGFDKEYVYFTLSQLVHAKDGIRGMRGLPIERDRHFRPTPLKMLFSGGN